MKKKVLVIEDDGEIFNIIKYLITGMGYEVFPVNDIIGFEKIKLHNPDLLLIDDWHPNCIGHSLCQQVKNNPLTAHVPVILLSTSQRIMDLLMSCGANDYLQKPFDIEELKGKVKFWLTQNTHCLIE